MADTMRIAFLTGLAALAAGFQGWALKRTNAVERTMFLAAGIALVDPAMAADLVGIGLVIVALTMQHFRRAPLPAGL